jgi:hypothetical protein
VTSSRLWLLVRWPQAAAATGLDATVRLGRIRSGRRSSLAALPLRLRAGTTVADVERASGSLASVFGCARVVVEPDSERSDRCVVVFHRLRLPRFSPYPVDGLALDGLLPQSSTMPLPLGVDANDDTVALPLFTDVGGTTLLIGGIPGTGKTAALRALLCGLAPTTASVFVIDPTGGAEALRWSGRLSAVVTDADPVRTCALLGQLLALVVRRGEVLGAGGETTMFPPVVLVCDELAELAAAGTSKQQDDARSLLRRLVALGRKTNVSCILSTQRTTSTSIDVTTRSLAGWRLALPHPDDATGSEALLGPGRRQAADLSRDDVGAGFLTNGGPPRLIRIFEATDGHVEALRTAGSGLSLCELEHLDSVALRELTS